MSRRKNTRGRKNQSDGADRMLILSHHAAARGDVLTCPADYLLKVPSMMINQRPPKNLRNMLFWIEDSFPFTISVPASGIVNENNIAFALSQFAQSAAIQALFDQYCIYSCVVRIVMPNYASSTFSSGGFLGRLHTAIDYDNVNAISTETAILQFGSVQSVELVIGKSYERFLKPCSSVASSQSNGTPIVGAPTRNWINSSSNSVPHHGLRILTVNNTTGASFIIDGFVTAIIGGRNTI